MDGTVTSKKIVGTVSSDGSLQGGVGALFAKDGDSAYQIALNNGFLGTEAEWLESLKGEKGEDGHTPVRGVDYFDGKNGYTPVKGVDYFDGKDGAKGEKGDPGPQGDKGEKGEKGDPGNDYALTKTDKEEIAQIVIEKLPVYDGSYNEYEVYDGSYTKGSV